MPAPLQGGIGYLLVVTSAGSRSLGEAAVDAVKKSGAVREPGALTSPGAFLRPQWTNEGTLVWHPAYGPSRRPVRSTGR